MVAQVPAHLASSTRVAVRAGVNPVALLRPHDDDPNRIDLEGRRELVLGELIGKGSGATVYRAGLREANGLERRVAVKLWASVASEESEQVLAVILGITQRVACVEHSNVARVFACGSWRGRPYIVMEHVAGVSLAAFQDSFAKRQRRMPLDLATFIAAEVAEGLAAARTARDRDGLTIGLLHHALSAREVLLSFGGEVKVTDFESSTTRGASSSIRSLRGVAARAATMAPEVAQGGEADPRSDVFSFGVLMRELFVGPRFPVSVSNSEAIRLARHGHVEPLTFMPHLPEGIIAVMERCLEIDPDQRYPHASALAFALRHEVLALGVGDGRYFLRDAVQREWEQAEDITQTS